MEIQFIFFYPIFILLIGYFFFHVSSKIGLVDVPNKRKDHFGRIPCIGGIVGGISITFYSYFFISDNTINLILFSGLIILFIGLLDDIFDLSFYYRLIIQFIMILFIIGNGIIIDNLGEYYLFGKIELGVFGILLTFLSISALTNSLNFIDGSDGLCAGIILISFLTMIILNIQILNEYWTFFYIIIIFLLIFLLFNLSNSNFKIFLGDSGSTFLGFILSVSIIHFTSSDLQFFHPSLVPWCVCLPIYDLLRVIFIRIKNNKNPFLPDKNHFHHILINLKLSRYQIFLFLMCLQVFFVLIGYMSFYYVNPDFTLILFPIIFFFYLIFVKKIESTNY